MTGTDLYWDLTVAIYSPPLYDRRDDGRVADIAVPLHVVILFIDFETEVSMNGILDFIGNSTGIYARETVEALKLIGATSQATALSAILDVADQVGMTHEQIQQERAGLEPFTITTFRDLHGDKWELARDKIYELEAAIDFEGAVELAIGFVTKHQVEIEHELGVGPPN